MAKKEYTRWAIIGECGLYVGQCLTRAAAIAEHVSTRDDSLRKFAPLDEDQLAQWGKCKANGDRAVKVRIIVDVGGSR